MADLKYNKALEFDRGFRGIRRMSSAPYFDAVVEAFVMNMARVDSQIHFPVMVANWSAHWAMATATARYEAQKKPVAPFPSESTDSSGIIARAATLVTTHFQSPNNNPLNFTEDINKFANGPWATMFPRLRMQSLMASQIIGSLTAVEVLLSDLWVMALNEGPKSLAANAINANNKYTMGLKEDRGDVSKTQKPTIPISCIEEYDYDLSHRMGNLLLDQGKVDFKSIGSAAAAYRLTFDGTPVAGLFNECEELFSDIHVLSLLRNVLVHNGGKADAKFVRGVAKHKHSSLKSLFTLRDSTDVPIDGELSGKMTDCAAKFGVALISAVEKVLSASDAHTSASGA